jgi:peptide/nickel transport system substrate-binding protein
VILFRTFLFCLLALTLPGEGRTANSDEPRPLVIATGTLPPGRANPHDSYSITRGWLYAAIYDSLTFIDREGRLTPWLAEKWDQEDALTWVFKIRSNARFSNGAPLTASDVVKNIDYLTSPSGKVEPVAPFVASIVSAEAIGDDTVRLHTAKSDPVLPRKLSVIRIAAFDDGGPFTRDRLIQTAIGSGPYKIEDWSPGGATLVAVPEAWRRAPTQVLRTLSAPDAVARRTVMTTGAADIAFAAFFFDDLENPLLPYNLDVDEIPAVVALAYNTVKETPLQDVRVRRALSYAVDAKSIIDTLFAGRAGRASQPARKESFGYNPELTPTDYDPDKAKSLLREAGYEDGFAFEMSITSGATVWDQVFQIVAANLAKVNVRLTIRPIREPAFAEQLYSTGVESDAFAMAYLTPTFDAIDSLRLNTCSWHVTSYCDPIAQSITDQALAALDLERRSQLTRDLMARTHEMAQAMFLYESVGLVGYSKRITGFRSDFGFLRYELMTVAD